MCIYIYMHTHMFMYICKCSCICTHTYMHACMHVCIHTWLQIKQLPSHIHACMAYMHPCIHAYMYAYVTCMHTCIHAYMRLLVCSFACLFVRLFVCLFVGVCVCVRLGMRARTSVRRCVLPPHRVDKVLHPSCLTSAPQATVEQYEIHWAQLSGSTASPVSLVETITTASDNELPGPLFEGR